jgi:hypothetical protein
MCPHTTHTTICAIYVSSHIVGMRTGVSGVAVHHTAMYLDNAAICVLILLILLYVCPRTTVYVSSYYYIRPHTSVCFHTTIYVSSYYYICVLILLYMCPHTTVCVLILLYMCPHTIIYVSSYYYICVLILLYMCPRTTIYVSSYYYMCVLIPLYTGAHTTLHRLCIDSCFF